MNHEEKVLEKLPPRGIFPVEAPRYPNLWFLVSEKLALRREYLYALRWLMGLLERELGLRDTFESGLENGNLLRLLENPGEGSDFQARMGPFQPYTDAATPALSHRHQVHARFYVSPLIQSGHGRIDGSLVIPASVHYEVATEEPVHPYVDTCPLCGITGEYALPVDRKSQDYCQKIHDPLGLEAILYGRIRGREIPGGDGGRIPCVSDLERFCDCRIADVRSGTPHGSTRLAVVTLGPRG